MQKKKKKETSVYWFEIFEIKIRYTTLIHDEDFIYSENFGFLVWVSRDSFSSFQKEKKRT